MKKVIALICLGILIFSLSACALFQKPPAGADEQAAWIAQSKTNLDAAAAGENLLFVTFTILCVESTIDQKTCVLGNALDKAWNVDYSAAKDALDKFERKEITQLAAQRMVDKALLESLVAVTQALKAQTEKPANLKANKIRSSDLMLPAGERK